MNKLFIYSKQTSKQLVTNKTVKIHKGKYRSQKGTVISYNKKGKVKIDLNSKSIYVHYSNIGYE